MFHTHPTSFWCVPRDVQLDYGLETVQTIVGAWIHGFWTIPGPFCRCVWGHCLADISLKATLIFIDTLGIAEGTEATPTLPTTPTDDDKRNFEDWQKRSHQGLSLLLVSVKPSVHQCYTPCNTGTLTHASSRPKLLLKTSTEYPALPQTLVSIFRTPCLDPAQPPSAPCPCPATLTEAS